jgi:acetoin utilization deacetylase AcuC-like enzyme
MMTTRLDTIPVFYTPRMVADSESFSPSAAKPAAVAASWRRLGVPLSFHEPEPTTMAQLALAHAPGYVADVMQRRRSNGFGNRSAMIAQTLPFTNGAMLAAAREALRNGLVAAATCSGFHHATYDAGGGFCTFNGLMVAACVLLQESVVRRVGILDFDQHWGNGTADIIKRLGLEGQVSHFHPSMVAGIEYRPSLFLRQIPEIAEQFADCDLVLYQAGADPHIDDPLGGWLTTEDLKERDRQVFRSFFRMGIPIAWNLAGGYQRDENGSIRPVLDIHDNTLMACAEVHPGGACPSIDISQQPSGSSVGSVQTLHA